MIQFNLLPSIKVEYIKAKKAKRLAGKLASWIEKRDPKALNSAFPEMIVTVLPLSSCFTPPDILSQTDCFHFTKVGISTSMPPLMFKPMVLKSC